MKAFIAAIALTTIGLVGPAQSQTTTPPNGTTEMSPAIISPKIDIRVRTNVMTNIPLNTPSAINLSTLDVPGASKGLTDGVTVKAYTRYVEFEGRKIGQLVLSGVEKNGQLEPLPTEGFSAQFDLEAPQLAPTREVVIKGDRAAILSALERLAETPADAPAETVVSTNDGNNAQKQETGAPTQQNDQAASYQTPEPVTISESGESITVTKNGCQIRPDIQQKRAFQQTKIVTIKNGATVSESECSDSNESFPIEPSYSTCPYDENLDPAVRLATAQYQLYYNDGVGNRQPVGDCTPDPEKVMPIIEKACPLYLDFTALPKAVPQSSLVYQDLNNKEVPVRGCQASDENPALTMTKSTNVCTPREDVLSGITYEQYAYTYVLNGITNKASDCTDSDVEYVTTKQGCPIRPDTNQKRAYQQTKTVKMKGTVILSETECVDSNESYPIEPIYASCPYDENLDPAVRTATAQFQLQYNNALGIKQPVGDCTPDPEKVFPIVEKTCSTFLDYSNMKAVPNSSLVYTNHTNEEKEVRSCQASETKVAVDLKPTTDGCGIREEFGTVNKSFQQGTHTYVLDGVLYQAGDCTDNGTEYPHAKVYVDAANELLCAPVPDAQGNPMTPQSRVMIEVSGVPVYITPCTPDTAGTVTITATTDKCDNPATWTHELNVGQSFGMERYFFLENGVEIPVTLCQNSTTTYPHEEQIVAWEPHDDLLFAYPKTTVSITPPTGKYDIVVSQVLSGATQMPYQLTDTAEESTGIPDYPDNSCTKYILTETFESWKRPDNTVHKKSIGAGTPINAGYDCTGQGGHTPDDWQLIGISYGGCNPTGDTNWRYKYSIANPVQMRGTRRLVRSDGTVIQTETRDVLTDDGGSYSGCTSAIPWTDTHGAQHAVASRFSPPTQAMVDGFFSSANFTY